MRGYYGIILSMNTCECGCGIEVQNGKRFVTHHNLKTLIRTEQHCRNIGESQKKAWQTKRARMPIGTKWIDAGGYVRVKVVEGSGKWRLEHVLVIEKSISRSLIKGEIVHHINGNRQDNRPENLFLCKDQSDHNRVHRSQDVALRACLEAGIVTFREGQYEALL